MFFRKKNREIETESNAEGDKAAPFRRPVKGTAPQLVEADSSRMADVEETVASAVIAPKGDNGESMSLAVAESGDRTPATEADLDAIRLFPGFEREDFEVGFRADRDAPSLVIRWKDGGEWFTVPGLFNRGVLSAMDERETAGDLNRLLRNYGYDVDGTPD
jgi:hypothetical protein